MDNNLTPITAMQWPYLLILQRMSLAIMVGLFIGIERERRGKEAGLCTFGIIALTGCIGALLGNNFAILSIILSIVPIVLINIHTLYQNQGIQLNTSVALLITTFIGVLCGQGHTFVPASVSVITTALLAWKRPLVGFSHGLTDAELRSAILLAILAIVIYPALPEGSIDRWGAFEPRSAWITVILIAGIGFINYILLKVYGKKGLEIAGLLGGLVNSTVTVSELSSRVAESKGRLASVAYRGILLATIAMIIRNIIIIALITPTVLSSVAVTFTIMLIALAAFVFRRHQEISIVDGNETDLITLETPFSLKSALKFGALFLLIQLAGLIGQRTVGQVGVYAISLFGGLFSSASAVAAVTTLAAQGTISSDVAGTSSIIATLASVVVNLPLVMRSQARPLIIKLTTTISLVVVLGLIGIWLQPIVANTLVQWVKSMAQKLN